jgi:hypothetical protein
MCFRHGTSPGEAGQPHHERGSEEDQGASWHITGINLRIKSSSVCNSNIAFELALGALGLGVQGPALVPSLATYCYRNCPPPFKQGLLREDSGLFFGCADIRQWGIVLRSFTGKSDQRDPPVSIRGVTCPRTQWGKSFCLSRHPPSTRTGAGISFEGRTHCPKTRQAAMLFFPKGRRKALGPLV